jgi:hypothetical protein
MDLLYFGCREVIRQLFLGQMFDLLLQIEFHKVNKQIDCSRSNIILLELDA